MKSPVLKGRLHQEYFRNGQHHRGGADVSFKDIVKIFGFKGVAIGKWVTKEEQQIAANLFFDALCDLMEILQVPEAVISLNGTLSLSFGVGGHKHACAHYNSAKRQLALAKNAGGGALAHEFFHAFDHFICNKIYHNTSINMFATEAWLNDIGDFNPHPLNEDLRSAFEAMFLQGNQSGPSELMLSSISADKQFKTFYYARPQEIAARAFERIVQEHHIKNAFLVKGTMQSNEAKIGLYPANEELARIRTPLLRYFHRLGHALVNKKN